MQRGPPGLKFNNNKTPQTIIDNPHLQSKIAILVRSSAPKYHSIRVWKHGASMVMVTSIGVGFELLGIIGFRSAAWEM